MDELTQQAWYLWAKSDRDYKADGRWLPVLNHLIDVAACAWEILELEPAQTLELFTQDYGLAVPDARRLVCALVGLHDLGKASPTFQRLWDMAKVRPLPGVTRLVAPTTGQNVPHGQVSQLMLPSLLKLFGWSSDLANRVADAIGCHHGRRSQKGKVDSITDAECGTGGWTEARLLLLEQVFLAVGIDPEQPTAPLLSNLSAPAFMRLAGLTSFADWVGSSFEVSSVLDTLPIEDPATYFVQARAKARDKLKIIGWTQRAPLQAEVQSPAELFSYLPDFKPRQLQLQLAAALKRLPAVPTLILVEAPMGEGKTEAGLHAATWLQSKLGHRGLYVALPTQATGNAMYTRVTTFLHHAAAGRDIIPDLQLLHGGTLLNGEYQAAITRTLERKLNPANDPSTADEDRLNVRAEGWFSVRKRANLTEYGVGTVDQALLGVLGVPHQFVRLWGLSNRVVLLDEIHAYDTYTSRLIHALLSWLRALGSSVIVMSATLPAASHRALLDAWGADESGAVADYPRLTLAQGNVAKSEHIAASREQTPITVRALDAGNVASKALELAVDGGCVAVIVNTVQRAQEVFQEIDQLTNRVAKTPIRGVGKGTLDPLCLLLFHARYPADERETRENAVLRYLGPQPYENKARNVPPADYRPRRMILIATQVAEQSLDFDADVMISDLAPMDLLLQRAGRLHRHRANDKRRHAHAQPELWVAGLDTWPQQVMEQQAWKWVYAPHLLYRTWLCLHEGLRIELPGDLNTLVQKVYSDISLLSTGDERSEQMLEAQAAFELKLMNDWTLGGLTHIGLPEQFFNTPVHVQPEQSGESVQDDADSNWPQTRLGEKSVRVVPVFRIGTTCYLDREGTISACLRGATLTADQSASIFRRSLRVVRWQLVDQADDAAPKHTSWDNNGLVQDCVPLVFEHGVAVDIRGLIVNLDPELGLVYTKPDSTQS